MIESWFRLKEQSGANGGLPERQAAVVCGNVSVRQHGKSRRPQLRRHAFEQHAILEAATR
jgi:hypothetical protein